MNDIRSFVLLKYQIITSDKSTWHLCETYPAEVKDKWSRRCAENVEYLTVGCPEAVQFIEMAKKCNACLDTELGLDTIFNKMLKLIKWDQERSVYYSVKSTYCALAGISAEASYYAAWAVAWDKDQTKATYEIMFDRNIEWLIEELCEWEMKQ